MTTKNYKVLLFFLGLLFICCNRYLYRCDYSLINPQTQKSKDLIYSDSLIDISFLIISDNATVDLVLENKIDRAIKINWDEVSYVGPSGKANRVIHTGVRLIEKDAPQAPTVIPPRAKLNDAITPVSMIYWGRGRNFFDNDGWQTTSLFADYKKEDLENKEMSIYFPLEIGGEKKEYTFTFKISNVKLDTLRAQSGGTWR